MEEVLHGWFEEHASDLFQYAARRVGEDVAEDVLAETFRRGIESLDSFDPSRGSVRGWLFGIATNVLHKYRRTEARRLAALARLSGTRPSVADPLLERAAALDAERELGLVLDAAQRLEPSDLDLLVLVAWEGMTSQEVAEVLGVPAGTVRSRLQRIRRQLDSARQHTEEERL